MSRDFTEDQNNELEALESIYFDELEVLDEDRRKFKISVCTDEYKETGDGLSCDLVFQYTKTYPDEAPIIEIESDVNFEKDTSEKIKEALDQTIQENLGMEMIFSLVGCTQELLNTLFDQLKIDREEQREKAQRETEELEQKKFEGTRVSVETFMNWKNAFEAEMGIAERRAKENEANRKLTGRELFLKDQSLLDSDIRFLNENGDSIENVKIDESLFQNLDLEVDDLPSDEDDESDDDPDYKP